MKKILVFYIAFFIFIVSLLAYQGCAELDKSLVAPQSAPGVHPAGWADSTNVNFHGAYIAKTNWNLKTCKTCHGGDFKGGTAGVSCFTCHTGSNGPESCNTCHGSRDPSYTHSWPPQSLSHLWDETDRGVGAHNHHLSPDSTERYSARVACSECHLHLASFDDPNHIDSTRHGAALITFGVLAHNSIGGGVTPNPTYDPVTNSCSQVYCHGYFKNGNLNFQPTFNNPESVTCGSCHGDPISGNPTPGAPNNFQPPHYSFFTINTCWQCHSSVIDSSGTIIAPSLHINGQINVFPEDKHSPGKKSMFKNAGDQKRTE